MKRWLSILVIFVCIIALSGCENEKRQAYFNAKVLEVNKEYVDARQREREISSRCSCNIYF